MINYCTKKRDISDTLWSVFTSFGFTETEQPEEDLKIMRENKLKLFYMDRERAELFCDTATPRARAEMVAACIEAALANELAELEVSLCDIAVYDLLVLYGFEELINLHEEDKKGFTIKSGGEIFAEGGFSEMESSCAFYINPFLRALGKAGIDTEMNDVSASLIFAEKDAEGVAYEIAFTLRMNGCIIEFYNEDGNIDDAQAYADKKGITCIIRAFDDGRMMIKDDVKNEIIETTVGEFLGYYDETECDCGHEHHHDGCDCGHHHGH